MTIQESLKRFRKDYNLTQRELCTALNLQQSQYARYETHQQIPVELIKRICIEYNVSADYLLGLK